VPPDALSIYVGAWDTEGEAVYLLKQIGEAQFALVSSAYHMPRAMRQFRDKGLRPIPSPCEFKARAVPHLYKCFVPDASALFDSQLAIHEYLGMLWMTVKRLLS